MKFVRSKFFFVITVSKVNGSRDIFESNSEQRCVVHKHFRKIKINVPNSNCKKKKLT